MVGDLTQVIMAIGKIISPFTDGINHINAYSKGRTDLGRMLSNFYHSPFMHPELGQFASMEGFWFYIRNGCRDDVLRTLFGYDAKCYGSELPSVRTSNFESLIYEGLECKLEQNQEILEACLDNNLPYYHYYVYDEFEPVRLDESLYIIALRKTIQKLSVF